MMPRYDSNPKRQPGLNGATRHLGTPTRHAAPAARRAVVRVALVLAVVAGAGLVSGKDAEPATRGRDASPIPDPRQIGGEPEGVVQVANLVYAGVKSSQCFSDHFLIKAQKDTAISTSRRFHAVKLSDDDIYAHPLLIMTGEGVFQLTDRERENLRRYVVRGGFLLASAGCSSEEWDRSFRREMASIFTDHSLQPLGMEHPVFHTVQDISELRAKHGTPRPLEGITISGRLVIIYSPDGLNDTQHMQGCCCCGGNEVTNAVDVNVNILAYALTH